jgi:hypothetical protein
MYSTCIFCHTSLGGNEAIEHFPVGRRLAFDAAKGRLWVVCRECERWNLSPLEERWEAIEECERLFRGTKLRVSTDNIGLARLKEGTTLVRVGEPQRPEMAAWRYGDQFHRRRRKHYVLVAGGTVVFAGVVIGGAMAGMITGGAANLVYQLYKAPKHRTVTRLRVNGAVLRVSQDMIDGITMAPDLRGGIEMKIRHKPTSSAMWIHDRKPSVVLSGDEAMRAARHLLPRINRAGGTPEDVAEAVRVLESTPGADALFGRFAKITGAERAHPQTVASLRAPARLALEMSLHEADERRALEGELWLLEDRWREAEEVAAIADDMFVPTGVSAMLRKLKGS